MENCWEEVPHSSQDCYPHYNLFQSSIFYDTDNFRVSYLLEDCLPCASSENEERSAEPPDKPPEVPPCKPKRVISKHELYRDPDLFQSHDGQSNSNGAIEPPTLPHPWGYDWTKQSWVKAAAHELVLPKNENIEVTNRNKAPRVNNSKAESMMHKMGWQGGALGKAGRGIVEPLASDPVYAFRSSTGLGHAAGAEPARAAGKKPLKRDHFRTNLLLHILEFVQDDTATELALDGSLRQHERRLVAGLVGAVVNDGALHSLGSAAQYDLARDIHAQNKYVLQCVAEHNQLTIYKEAPEDVYLVTPEDFLAKDDADDISDKHDMRDKHDSRDKSDKHNVSDQRDISVKTDKNDVSDKSNGEVEDDENPFLKSIKKSIKKDDEPKSITNKFETDCVIEKNDAKDDGRKNECPAADKMLEFFLEFAETDVYKEMRFLGTFSEPQSSAITALLSDVSLWEAGVPAGPARARRAAAGAFRVQHGVHGTPEIHKVPASPNRRIENT